MKDKLSTEGRIVATALEMFNRVGIEYVGMREIATALGLRIGNLTYYFPTKDDLVNRLSLDLGERNSQVIVPVEDLNMTGFFVMLESVFHNHIAYRCLMLSFVHVMERNPLIAKRYEKVQRKRSETWTQNILALAKGKYITADKSEVDFLVSTIALIARFWVSEAAVSYKDTAVEQQVRHYLNMIARIFLPYATVRGRPELKRFIV